MKESQRGQWLATTCSVYPTLLNIPIYLIRLFYPIIPFYLFQRRIRIAIEDIKHSCILLSVFRLQRKYIISNPWNSAVVEVRLPGISLIYSSNSIRVISCLHHHGFPSHGKRQTAGTTGSQSFRQCLLAGLPQTPNHLYKSPNRFPQHPRPSFICSAVSSEAESPGTQWTSVNWNNLFKLLVCIEFQHILRFTGIIPTQSRANTPHNVFIFFHHPKIYLNWITANHQGLSEVLSLPPNCSFKAASTWVALLLYSSWWIHPAIR